MKTRVVVVLAVLTFCVALAIVIDQRLSGEAMAVLLGVIAGVGASIPTSLIVVWLTVRNSTPAQRTVEVRQAPADEEPRERVVVVQAPDATDGGYVTGPVRPAYANVPRRAAMQPPPPRKFTVIGGASELDEVPRSAEQSEMEESTWLR